MASFISETTRSTGMDAGAAGSTPMSPDDLRLAKPEQHLVGYRRSSVDRLLDEIRQSYERVWRERDRARTDLARERASADLVRAERAELQRRVAELSEEPDRLKAENERLTALVAELRTQLETTTREADVAAAAERRLRRLLAGADGLAAETRANARAEAELTLRKARERGELLQRRSERRVEKERQELERLQKIQSRIHGELRQFVLQSLAWLDRDGARAASSLDEVVDLLTARAGSRRELDAGTSDADSGTPA